MSHFDAEAQRIRAEYARRERELPADRYGLHEPVNLFFRHGRERALLQSLRTAGLNSLADRTVLEVGCGRGQWFRFYEDLGTEPCRVAGIDLDDTRCAAARRRFPEADVRVGDAARLPWPDGTFDLVVQSTVFSSILDRDVRRAVAAEMLRVVRPSGAIAWYDFFYDNPNNPHVRGVGKAEVRELFPSCDIRFARTTLAPPLARRIVPHSWGFAGFLESLRLLNTHYLALIRHSGTPAA